MRLGPGMDLLQCLNSYDRLPRRNLIKFPFRNAITSIAGLMKSAPHKAVLMMTC